MDYNSKIKETLSKLLFLEVEIDGFKKNIGIPKDVVFENKELYIPISASYISSNINDQIKLKNLPVFYFIEGMFMAIGCDQNLKYCNDYKTILNWMKDTESCIKSSISKKINDNKLLEGYILLKGFYRYSGYVDVMEKLLLVGENLRQQDKGFTDILLEDINFCEDNNLKLPEAYLYKSIILKEKGEFKSAKVALKEYEKIGGKKTKEVEILNDDVENILDYEKAIELLDSNPTKSIELLLNLANKFEENPLIYYYLGLGFRKLGYFEKAIYYLEQSVKRESGILEVVVELGLNYACLQNYHKALDLFRKAFEASREIGICTNIIMCYINLDDINNAKLHYNIAKEISPDDEILKEIEVILFQKK